MNRLAAETSPYLRQHADNPVDWLPWGPEAFEQARRQDKPVFVSIGYASCHWCHVMAHESFADPAVADDLSRWFVSVKVDREERPDVDAVYMAAVVAMSGSGGWPMSVFCTPDGRPFFAGTYFPPTDRAGMPSFRRLLAALADAWSTRRDEVEAQADALLQAAAGELDLADRLAAARPPGEEGRWPEPGAVLGRAVAELAEKFDPEWGGFGPAPKFPRPTYVELCLRHQRGGDPVALAMATTTLDAMAAGGIYDHLAGGFARYSTDRRWLVPHFEKMLTDQALLARGYLHAWQVTGRADYRQVVAETLGYVLSDLSGKGGGLCSSEDADADGVEGGHATFTPAQVGEALAGHPDLLGPALDWYGVTEAGNWEGTTVLSRPPGAPLARPPEVESARRLLLEARRRRPRPARDDKVVCEWNAMAAAVVAEAAGAMDDAGWAGRAEEVGDLLFTAGRLADGRWARTVGGHQPAFAADYAWLLECCTRLAELSGRAQWTSRGAEVADALLDRFFDSADGGVFTTGRDGERLVVRPKELLDGATPSANSVAASALARLGALTGDDRYRLAAERIVRLAGPLLADHPTAVADLVGAASMLDAPSEVVVAGHRPDLLSEVRRRWLPDAVVAWGEPTSSPLWEGRAPGAAYVCHRYACRAPAADPATLSAQLDDASSGGTATGG
ncbi:MAG: thioredoxin domain-containing protein [Acidimicrobiales bacterium]